jgi:hypothetical protein
MYNSKIAAEWGSLVYPFIIEPTMKELALSKGQTSENYQRLTGIKSKGTHFKLDTPNGKVGQKEIHIIYAKDDDSLNDFTRTLTLVAIPVRAVKRKK